MEVGEKCNESQRIDISGHLSVHDKGTTPYGSAAFICGFSYHTCCDLMSRHKVANFALKDNMRHNAL